MYDYNIVLTKENRSPPLLQHWVSALGELARHAHHYL